MKRGRRQEAGSAARVKIAEERATRARLFDAGFDVFRGIGRVV